ncbi:MAG: hemerythrin domain-containing protein [Dehalococcoidales bacterium]|nr:hemerythrin domain-containing protein [Dehalococcoidales bacterium]
MKPIGPLMREHRLIERMVALVNKQLLQIQEKNSADIRFISQAIDFFRTYADRTHHGKEENILFKALDAKPLSPEHRRMMNELVQEHVFGRQKVGQLAQAGDKYDHGDKESLFEITSCLKELSVFYPAHILKEDAHFFYPCLEYLSKTEQDDMLQEFWEFDRTLIHEKYQQMVEKLTTGLT